MALETVLFTIGALLTPGFPNFIFREILAIILAFFLPSFIVRPVNMITLIVFPPIVVFQKKMEEYPRIRTILPAFLAAEILLIVTGVTLIIISRTI